MSDYAKSAAKAYAKGLHLGRVEARQVERILTDLIAEVRSTGYPQHECHECSDRWWDVDAATDRAKARLREVTGDE